MSYDQQVNNAADQIRAIWATGRLVDPCEHFFVRGQQFVFDVLTALADGRFISPVELCKGDWQQEGF